MLNILYKAIVFSVVAVVSCAAGYISVDFFFYQWDMEIYESKLEWNAQGHDIDLPAHPPEKPWWLK